MIQYTSNPCEHFARIGYDAIAATVPFDDSYPHDEDGLDYAGQCRRWKDVRVLAILRGEPVKDRKKSKPAAGEDDVPVMLAGHRIDWPIHLPELKVWAGGASLESMVKGRRAALHAAGGLPVGTALREWLLPYPTMSGLDPRSAKSSLDIGFSPSRAGIPIMTYVADELLAVVGLQLATIIRYGRKEFGYVDPDGQWWKFRIETREQHHRMFGWAAPTTQGEQ